MQSKILKLGKPTRTYATKSRAAFISKKTAIDSEFFNNVIFDGASGSGYSWTSAQCNAYSKRYLGVENPIKTSKGLAS